MSRKTRKLIWSVPLVAVLAVASALAAFGALGIGGVFAHGAPSAPKHVVVKAADGPDGRTTLVLDWDEPDEGAVDRYRIDVSKEGGQFTYHTSTTATTYTHEGLKASTKRYYRVFAVSDTAGTSPVSRDVSETTNPTSKPAKVALSSPTPQSPTQIDLSWQMPDNGGAPISRYCVAANKLLPDGMVDGIEAMISMTTCSATASTGTDANKVIVVDAPDTIYMHKNLSAEETWRYEVYALNSQGHSRLGSDQRQAKTDPALRPAAPTKLTLIQAADISSEPVLRLYWNGPTTNGGQAIVGYRIEVSDTQGHWPNPPALPNDTWESTRDSTGNLAEDSEARNTVVISIAPQTTGNAGTSSYQLQHTLSHETIADFSFADKLHYRVRTETGEVADREVSLWSTVGTVTIVDEEDLNLITNTSAMATVVDDNKTGEIKLTFSGTMRDLPGPDTGTPDAPFNDPSGYRVDISADLGLTWQTEIDTTNRIDGNEYEQRNVKPGAMRHFRVFAWDGSDIGIASVIAVGTAGRVKVPGKVDDLVAEAPALPAGAGQIDLSWATPISDGGGAIKRYCIEANRINADGGPLGMAVMITPQICSATMDPTGNKTVNTVIIINPEDANGNPVTGYEHKGLRAEDRWRYRVFAVNSAGYAVSSDTVDDETGKADTPPAPENLTKESAHDSNSTPAGTRGVVLLWTTPADPPGAPVTGYRVQRSINDSVFETVRSTEFTHWVDRQQPADGEVRAYRAVAINAVGHDETDYSEIKFRVEGTGDDQMLILVPEHTHPPASTVLTKPSDVMATVGVTDPGDITVTWTPGENAPGGHLVLLFNSDFTEVPHVGTPTEEGMYTIPDVATAGNYVVVVVSVKSRSEYMYDYARVNVP